MTLGSRHLARILAAAFAFASAAGAWAAPTAARGSRPKDDAASSRLREGEAALAARDWATAERKIREAVKISPRLARAHSDLAAVLLMSGQAGDEALEESRRAAELDPADLTYLVRYGATLETAGRLVEARAVLRRARARRPSDPQILLLLADCSARLGDDEAIPLLRKVVATSPKNLAARTTLARLLWARNDAAGGDAVMDRALRAFPGEAELHAEFGRSLLERLQFRRAIEQLSRAREGGSRSAPLLNALGEAFWEAGRGAEARSAFEEAIAADGGFFPARLALGRLLLWMGKPRESAEALRAAIDLREDSAPAQWTLGRALTSLGEGEAEAAERALRRAVELAPENSRFHYSLATFLKQRRDPGAEAELRRFRETSEAEQKAAFEAGSRQVELNGARDDLRRGRAEEALKRFQALPESASVLRGESEAFARLGRHEEALAALERATELDPDDVSIRAALAREYAEARGSR